MDTWEEGTQRRDREGNRDPGKKGRRHKEGRTEIQGVGTETQTEGDRDPDRQGQRHRERGTETQSEGDRNPERGVG